MEKVPTVKLPPVTLPTSGRSVAVTGIRTHLGTELLARLDVDPRFERVLALDVRAPTQRFDKAEFHRIDLTRPGVSTELATLLGEHQVDSVFHGAFLSHPSHSASWAHELEDVGTMHMLDACARATPSRLVLLSTTLAYGARASNPNHLTESDELDAPQTSQYLWDKVGVDKQAQRFADAHPEIATAVLRMAPTLGPTVDNFFTHFFSRPVLPSLLGHDPLIQFLHEDDAVEAAFLALASTVRGPFNIVADGVLPYSGVLALMGKLPMPLPGFVAHSLARFLWTAQLSSAPPGFTDYLRYSCVADGARAQNELGFTARHNIRTTVEDFPVSRQRRWP